MNILFLSLSFSTAEHKSFYEDLLNVFYKNGHQVYIACANEKKSQEKSGISNIHGLKVIRINTGNITGNISTIEKGISTFTIDSIFIKSIKKYFDNIKFDLIIYPTPPITFVKTISYIKKNTGAKTYLLLKDIFPQNAVDLEMMSKTGIKGIIYRYFREQEKKLYRISDRIGCMSQANVDYVLEHNPDVKIRNNVSIRQTGKPIVEICPNSIEPIDLSISIEEKNRIRDKYNLPLDKTIFVYGGNLGKPQGIPFLIKCIRACQDIKDAYFFIVGSGTEYYLIEDYIKNEQPTNIRLMKSIPKEEYDTMIAACDVGMIFLDHRFTIPNFPSRMLSYMQANLPILACTDPNTDIGEVITGIDRNGNKTHEPFGWWCESKSTILFKKTVRNVAKKPFRYLGENGFYYMKRHFSVVDNVKIILSGDIQTEK